MLLSFHFRQSKVVFIYINSFFGSIFLVWFPLLSMSVQEMTGEIKAVVSLKNSVFAANNGCKCSCQIELNKVLHMAQKEQQRLILFPKRSAESKVRILKKIWPFDLLKRKHRVTKLDIKRRALSLQNLWASTPCGRKLLFLIM